jgi:hypothetical protein
MPLDSRSRTANARRPTPPWPLIVGYSKPVGPGPGYTGRPGAGAGSRRDAPEPTCRALLAQHAIARLIAGLGVVLVAGCTMPNPAWWVEAAVPDAGAPTQKPAGGQDVSQPEAPSARDDASAVEVVAPAADVDVDGTVDGAAALETAPEVRVETAPAEPPHIVMLGAAETPKRGGSGGGSHIDECADDEAVIGYRGSIEPTPEGDLVGSLQTQCGQLNLGQAAGGSPVEIRATPNLTTRGNTRALSWDAKCPRDQVVVSYDCRAGDSLDQVRFHCVGLSLSADGTSIVLGTAGTTTPAYGGSGGAPYEDTCGQGQIAHGSNTRTGSRVDAFSLVCATPTLAP